MATTAAGNLTKALGTVRQGVTNAAWITSIISLVIGIIFLGAGLWIYFKKIKSSEGKEKVSGLLYGAAIILILLGIILLFNGILGIIVILMAPTIVQGLYG